jgi:undecaprenyl-diphosphatase
MDRAAPDVGANSASYIQKDSSGRAGRLLKMVAGGVLLAALGVFSFAASFVDRFPGELAASTWVQSWRISWLDTAMKVIGIPGTVPVAFLLLLVAALALYLMGLRKQGGLILAATSAGYVIRTALKMLIARPRPTDDLVQVIEQADGYSFPSGHVMHYVVFLGTLGFIVSTRMKPGVGRRVVQVAVVVALVAVGLSRIYLGAHWLGDVVAGYAFGAVVVAVAVWAWSRWPAGGRQSPAGESPRS